MRVVKGCSNPHAPTHKWVTAITVSARELSTIKVCSPAFSLASVARKYFPHVPLQMIYLPLIKAYAIREATGAFSMKLGVFSPVFVNRTLDQVVAKLRSLPGVSAIPAVISRAAKSAKVKKKGT